MVSIPVDDNSLVKPGSSLECSFQIRVILLRLTPLRVYQGECSLDNQSDWLLISENSHAIHSGDMTADFGAILHISNVTVMLGTAEGRCFTSLTLQRTWHFSWYTPKWDSLHQANTSSPIVRFFPSWGNRLCLVLAIRLVFSAVCIF